MGTDEEVRLLALRQKKYNFRMKVSILHISDIHKGADMSLTTLLNSLVRDSERWDDEGIRQPDYIVLSGDVIQGGPTEEEIAQQYREAEGFLAELCNIFLNGHRERLIVVPGNHDVSWPYSGNCMVPVETTPERVKEYLRHNGKRDLRWNWEERQLSKIQSYSDYVHRFDQFVDFYNRFFDGIYTYPSDPEKAAMCIPLREHNLCFACFNSCCNNDHLNSAGEIHKDAIYSIDRELTTCFNQGMLPIGVWHHNAYGDPYQTDYMSKEVLDKLLEHRIKIGLFGHQHKSQVAEEYSDLLVPEEDRKRLLLISAGTLFGGDSEQHKGIRRQYNIIELDMENGQAIVSIHVREDGNNDVSSDDPYWRAKQLPGGAVITYHVRFKHVSDDEKLRIIDEETRKSGNYKRGIEALRASNIKNSFTQMMLDSYLRQLDDKDILSVLPEPETVNQCFFLIGVIDKEHDAEAYKRLASSPILQQALEKDTLLKEEFAKLSDKFK